MGAAACVKTCGCRNEGGIMLWVLFGLTPSSCEGRGVLVHRTPRRETSQSAKRTARRSAPNTGVPFLDMFQSPHLAPPSAKQDSQDGCASLQKKILAQKKKKFGKKKKKKKKKKK